MVFSHFGGFLQRRCHPAGVFRIEIKPSFITPISIPVAVFYLLFCVMIDNVDFYISAIDFDFYLVVLEPEGNQLHCSSPFSTSFWFQEPPSEDGSSLGRAASSAIRPL